MDLFKTKTDIQLAQMREHAEFQSKALVRAHQRIAELEKQVKQLKEKGK